VGAKVIEGLKVELLSIPPKAVGCKDSTSNVDGESVMLESSYIEDGSSVLLEISLLTKVGRNDEFVDCAIVGTFVICEISDESVPCEDGTIVGINFVDGDIVTDGKVVGVNVVNGEVVDVDVDVDVGATMGDRTVVGIDVDVGDTVGRVVDVDVGATMGDRTVVGIDVDVGDTVGRVEGNSLGDAVVCDCRMKILCSTGFDRCLNKDSDDSSLDSTSFNSDEHGNIRFRTNPKSFILKFLKWSAATLSFLRATKQNRTGTSLSLCLLRFSKLIVRNSSFRRKQV